MSLDEEENEMAALLEQKKKAHEQEEQAALIAASEQIREEMEILEEKIKVLREKQEVRKRWKQEEQHKMEEHRIREEAKRKEEEAERRRLREEELERKRQEKERKQREKEERAKNMGKKNFKIKKAEKSSLDQYNSNQSSGDMTKSKEQLEEEKRAILAQRIVPLNLSGMNEAALLEKVKELHDKLYKLESDKYDLDDRFQRQQYDMMELSERARQMNKGSGGVSSKPVEEEPTGPCPGKSSGGQGGFDRISDKYSNAPPRVLLASKYERNLDRRNFFEKMGCFEKEWIGEEGSSVTEELDNEP